MLLFRLNEFLDKLWTFETVCPLNERHLINLRTTTGYMLCWQKENENLLSSDRRSELGFGSPSKIEFPQQRKLEEIEKLKIGTQRTLFRKTLLPSDVSSIHVKKL